MRLLRAKLLYRTGRLGFVCVCVINATDHRITYPRPKVFSWWVIGKGCKVFYYLWKKKIKNKEKKKK